MRLVRRNGKITLLRRRWNRSSALLVGGATAVVALSVEHCLSSERFLDLPSATEESPSEESRRLFYPDDYVIGRWTEDGKETFERVPVHDDRYPDQNITVDDFVGSYKNAPFGRKLGIIVHIIGITYMLVGLNTVCDIYFCGALDEMVEQWEVQQDVAGATFMAAGGSAPELFTSIIGAVGTESDVGFSTIVGSAVFNVLAVIGACGMAATDPIQLSWWPLFRDCTYYIFSLCWLAVFAMGSNYSGDRKGPDGQLCDPDNAQKKCGGGKITLYEAIILFLMYVLYCTIMVFNSQLEAFSKRCAERFFGKAADRKVAPISNGTDDQHNDAKPKGDVPTSDAVGRTSIDNAEANYIEGHHLRRVLHNNNRASLRASRTNLQITTVELTAPRQEQVERPAQVKSKNVMLDDDEEEDVIQEKEAPTEPQDGQCPSNASDEEDDIDALMTIPDDAKERVAWVLCLPVYVPMYCVIPRPDRCFLGTFGISLFFIAFYSYFLVYCVKMFADAILGGGPGVEVIMGFTLLAAGTSIPDLVSSMAVARKGQGDMAISSSIGSNIFDILVGLPIPWIIKIGIIEMGINGNSDFGVAINSPYIPFYVFLLLFMVTCVICCILINRWKLNQALGIMMSILYLLFLAIVIPLELFQYI